MIGCKCHVANYQHNGVYRRRPWGITSLNLGIILAERRAGEGLKINVYYLSKRWGSCTEGILCGSGGQ